MDLAEDEVVTVDDALEAPWAMLEHNGQGGTAQTRRKFRELLEDLGAADRRVKEDYEGRYPIELLQNAHDACHDGDVVGTAWFVLTDTALLAANEGAPFDAQRIVSLTRLGSTSKGRQEATRHVIGYKGVGFSSVFSITDAPQVSSSGALFGFDASRALQLVTTALGGRPKQLSTRAFPFRLQTDDFGEDWGAVTELHAAGATTVIRLPLRERETRNAVADVLRDSLAPQSLLFMPSLDEIVVQIDAERHHWRRRPGKPEGSGRVVHIDTDGGQESWLVAAGTVPAPEQVRLLDDEIWHSVAELNVAAALPWRRGAIDPDRGPQRVHVYFPTDDRLDRSVLLHGDFFLHSSRRFIHALGHGGQVTRAVADGCIALAVSLAESVATSGPQLLQALAPHEGGCSGFGDTLVQQLDTALAESKIVRTAGTGPPKRAKDLRVLRSHLEPDDHVALLRSLREPQDIVHFDDDVGEASGLLEHLGARPLSNTEIAARVSAAKIRGGYEESLDLIRRWWGTVPRREEQAVRVALRRNQVVQDDQNKWHTPEEVYRYERDVPPPPPALRPPRLRPVERYELTQFASTTLGVRSLSAEALLEHVLDRIEDGTYGRRSDEARRLLTFLVGLYESHSDAFDEDDERLGEIRVPARRADGGQPEWRPAVATYLSSDLSGDDFVELLYGPFGDAEFVDASALDFGTNARTLLTTLGVAPAPRSVEMELVDPDEDDSVAPSIRAWLRDIDIPACPRGHMYLPRKFTISTIDRLADVVASRDQRRLLALAERLAKLEEPFGSSDWVACQRQCTAGRRPLRGYREWLLHTSPWVPVVDGGRRTLATPSSAWFGVPATFLDVLPTTTLPEDVSRALGCIEYERPPSEAIEAALARLARKTPDLQQADPGIRAVADELLSKLEAAAPGAEMACPPLPALRIQQAEWSRSPLVADLPGLELLPSVVRLPGGAGGWRGLQRAYGVRLASSVVDRQVRVEEALDEAPVLDDNTKAELLALLTATRSGAVRQLARRLGRLTDEPVSSVVLELRHGENSAVTAPLAHHLELGDLDDDGEAIAAILFSAISEQRANFPWCRTLADYVTPGSDRTATLLHTYFHARDDILAEYRVGPERVAQATEALRRWPFESDTVRHVVRSFDDLVPAEGVLDGPEDDENASSEELGGSERASREGVASGEDDAADEGIGGDWDVPWDDGEPKPQPSGETFGGRIERRASDGPGRPQSGLGPDWAPRKGVLDITFGEVDPRDADGGPKRSGAPAPRLPSTAPSAPSDAMPVTEVDARAMEVATAVGERLGAEVLRVDQQRLGWDLEFHFSDMLWWPVEVKGMADENEAFVLTRNELRAALEHADYHFLFVTGTRWLTGRVALVRASSAQLSDADLEPLSWTIAGWRSYPVEHAESWTNAVDTGS